MSFLEVVRAYRMYLCKHCKLKEVVCGHVLTPLQTYKEWIHNAGYPQYDVTVFDASSEEVRLELFNKNSSLCCDAPLGLLCSVCKTLTAERSC